MASFSKKMELQSRQISFEKTDTQPLFIPADRIRPETTSEAINRILVSSVARGDTLESAYQKLRGDYDGDESIENDDFDDFDDDDEFEMSQFAQYEDMKPIIEPEPEPEPPKEQTLPNLEATPPSEPVTPYNND